MHRPSLREPLSTRFWLTMTAVSLATGVITFVAIPDLGGHWGERWRTPAISADTPAAEPAATEPPVDVAAIERSVTYSGCREVRAAGAAPLYRGTPGYRTTMDGDGDGIACEPIR